VVASSKLPSISKLAGSTFLLTVLILIGFDLLVSATDPLKRLNATGFTSLRQYFVVSKLPEFLTSARKPEIIITGSSLMLYPNVRADDALAGRRQRTDAAYVRDVIDPYAYAHYLEQSLKHLTGRNYDIANLATAGGMISDQFVVFRKCLSADKKPSLLICDISPREFLDNNQVEPDKTPVYVVLSDFTCLADLLQAKASVDETGKAAIANLWSFYRNRGDWKYFFVQVASAATGHPTDIFNATQKGRSNNPEPSEPSQNLPAENCKSAATQPKIESKLAEGPKPYVDIPSYKAMYLPVNQKNYQIQFGYLKRLLSLAEEKHVPVLLVSMPLTKDNLALLPNEFLAQMQNQVDSLASQFHAEVVQPSAQVSFDDQADFEDSAHLNADGGKKLLDIIARQIANNSH
jgi:hypothetical protein